MNETTTAPTNRGTMNILDLEKFKRTVLFSITLRKWGNRAQVKDLASLQKYIEQMKAEPDPEGNGQAAQPAVILAGDRVKSSKVLIKSATFKTLCSELTAIKAWCLERCMPSQFRAGMFVFREDQVGVVEKEMRAKLDKLTAADGPLEKFLAAYPADIESARTAPVKKGGLGPLFREADYPGVDEMRKMFGLEWYWLALSVPENIPDELKAEAGEKFKRRLVEAADEIETALRVQFAELLKHAEERLTTEPGEKPKVFRDSLLGNLIGFIDTFDSKNVFGDDRLAGIVAQTKAVLVDDKGKARLTPDKLREYASVREEAKKKFAEIKGKIDAMIEEKKERQIELED